MKKSGKNKNIDLKKSKTVLYCINVKAAQVAKLADAPDLGSGPTG